MIDVEIIKEEIYKLMTLDKQYENGKVSETINCFEGNYKGSLVTVVEYAEAIDKFRKMKEYKKVTGEDITILDRAIELCKKLIRDEVFLDKEHSKERYEKENNTYNSLWYVEFPLKLVKGMPKPYDKLTVFGLYYSDIGSISNNLKRAYEDLKDNNTAIRVLEEIFGENFVDEEKEDLYFDKYKKLCKDEKIKFLKKDIEFTHLALGENDNSNWAIILSGSYEKKKESCVLPIEFTDFNTYNLERLKKAMRFDTLGVISNDVINRYEKLVNAV